MRGRAKARRRSGKRVARKAPTNLSLRVDLVRRAKRLGLNLSEVVETALEQAIEKREQASWLEQNQVAIAGYNAFVNKYGAFGDERRLF
ncbi:MAG: type II toxin-antitoxin system CcdA family antitoxin [Acidobacteriota bacterium]